MKRNWLLAALAVIVLCVALSFGAAKAEEAKQRVYRMPQALITIEAGAFEGTNASEVYLSDSVKSIGDRAFANMPNLRIIRIPKETIFIGEGAFDGQRALTIIGVAGSYADKWASEHGYRFISIDVWFAQRSGFGPVGGTLGRIIADEVDIQKQMITGLFETLDGVFNTDPSGRPEMYPIEYDFP